MKRFRTAFVHYLCKNELLRVIITAVMLLVCSFFEVTVGVVLASLAAGMMTIFVTITCFASEMPELVRFGSTRRSATLAGIAETLGVSLLYGLPLGLVLAISESLQCHDLTLVGEYLLIWLCAIPIAWMMGLLAAWCIRKFGQNGLMAMYFIYLAIFTVIPMLGNMLDDISFVQWLIVAFNANMYLLIALGAVAAIAVAALLVRLISRCDV